MCRTKNFFEDSMPETRVIHSIEDKELIKKNRAAYERLLTEYIIGTDRVNNALHRAGIFTVWDLLDSTIDYVKHIWFLGAGGLAEIEEALKSDEFYNVCLKAKISRAAAECIDSFELKETTGRSRDQIVRELIRDHAKSRSIERSLRDYA